MTEHQQEQATSIDQNVEPHVSKETTLKEVSIYDAIGLRLAHDLTQIIPGQFKGRLFTKGHLITEEDIPRLLDIGKEHIYVMELGKHDWHEDDAAHFMALALADEALIRTEPHEGKVAVKAQVTGIAKVDKSVVDQINDIGEIALATVRNNDVVQAGTTVAATRVIPLTVPKSKVALVEEIAAAYKQQVGHAPLQVLPIP